MNPARRRFLRGLGALGAWAAAGCTVLNRGAYRSTVLVIGGGYGGATAAKYLRLFAPEIRVCLIDPAEPYLSCPGSNDVIAGLQPLESLHRQRSGLAEHWGVELIKAVVAGIDAERRSVRLADGASLSYDRLILSPGIDFRWDALAGYDETASRIVPHAWKAGQQTLLLRDQLRAMPESGTVVISVPSTPYRCPPGPYERASLIAHSLRQYKPRAKLLILDAKTQFTKQALFQAAWRRHYPEIIEWHPYTETGKVERIDAAKRVIHTEFESFPADVLNVIPPQQAGLLARRNGLTDASGWCPVRVEDFASALLPHIHVVGDACIANPMPKSAFAAGSQAKICALAVAASLQEKPMPSPALINTCYSLVTPDQAVSVAGVYKIKEGRLNMVSGGETQLNADWRQEAKLAMEWRKTAGADAFN